MGGLTKNPPTQVKHSKIEESAATICYLFLLFLVILIKSSAIFLFTWMAYFLVLDKI